MRKRIFQIIEVGEENDKLSRVYDFFMMATMYDAIYWATIYFTVFLLCKAAIASGELSAERYELYKNLGSENTNNYAKKKEISKWAKAYKKNNKYLF